MKLIKSTENKLVFVKASLLKDCVELLERTRCENVDISPDYYTFYAAYDLTDDPSEDLNIAGFQVNFLPGMKEGDVFLVKTDISGQINEKIV